MTRCRVFATQEKSATTATFWPVEAYRAAIDVLGFDFELQANGKRPVRLDDDMGQARQVRRQSIYVENVPALKPGADIDDRQSAAGFSTNQLGGEIDIGVGEQMRSLAYWERTVCRSAKGL